MWRRIRFSPGFAALADALERHISADAAKIMHAPFSLGDADELHALLKGAGFVGIIVRIGIGTVRFPSLEEFVTQYVAATPFAGHVAKADEGARTAFLMDVSEALRPYADDEGVAFPIEGHLAVGGKGLDFAPRSS